MLPIVLLSLVFLATRFINLLLWPVFADEAIYIRWSQLIWQGQFFIPLTDGKTPLFMWLLSPLQQLTNQPLLSGRLLSVMAGLLTLIAVYLLADKLFDKRTALIAGLLTILNPFLLFYDRLSVVDSLLTAFITWSYYLSLNLLTNPSITLGIILGFLWIACLLTKPTALLFIFLTPVFCFSKKFSLKKIKALFWPTLVAVAITLIGYNLQRFSAAFPLISSRSSDYLRNINEIFSSWLQFFPATLSIVVSWLSSYLSVPALILFLLAVIWALTKKSVNILVLSLLIILPVFIQTSVANIFYPRYLLPIIPFLIIILAWGVKKLPKIIGLTLLFLSGFFWLKFDYLLLTDPLKAPLHSWERTQYLQEWSAGIGLKEIVGYLYQLPTDKTVYVFTEGSFGTLPDGQQIFFNQTPNIKIIGLGFPDQATNHPLILEVLETTDQVYLVANQNRFSFGDNKRLKLLAQYPRPNEDKSQSLMFYQVLP